MEISDLVKEDGALIRRFELADLELVSSGESPALVTEKLAFQKLSRDGGAVYLDEGAGLAHAELVDGPGDEVLAGAGFTANEDGDVCPRRLANNFSYLQHPRTCPEGKLVPQPATGVVLRFSPGRTSRASNSRLDELLQTIRSQRPLEDVMRPENVRLGYARRPARIGNDDHVAGVPAFRLQTFDVASSNCIKVYEAQQEPMLRERRPRLVSRADDDRLEAKAGHHAR